MSTRLAPRQIMIANRQNLAQRIDETKLVFQPNEDPKTSIRNLCENALKETFRAVCVRTAFIALAKSLLGDSPVMVATVIAFPQSRHPLAEQQQHPSFGQATWQEKVAEMNLAHEAGADEFDIVMNIPLFKSLAAEKKQDLLELELNPLVKNAQGIPIKLIIEADLLSDDDIIQATTLATQAGVAMVKTSTGMLNEGKGATLHNISLIYQAIQSLPQDNKPGIKASGGIRTAQQAIELIQAGADVIGSSSGTSLLNDFERSLLASNHS